MNRRPLAEGVYWMGAIDWDRRLFDALIPLPDGTSYNAYLVQGEEKTALLDTVDPPMTDVLAAQLADVPRLDYVVSHHTEQDHSGAIPAVLARYPEAQVVASPKAKPMLVDHLGVPEARVLTVEDGEAISLGGKTLRFLHTPWVHWPETMVTYLPEARILFSCDFFGSHLATTELLPDWSKAEAAAKRYYGEIMMPFARQVERNIEKVRALDLALIAPSHGPLHAEPATVISAWAHWASGPPANLVVIPYVSMHGSTQQMVEHLVGALAERGVGVEQFNLAVADLGKLATALVEAATIVIGTPTVLTRPHPLAVTAAFLANALRPKARFASVVGSYGWGGKTVETIAGLISDLKVEVLDPVLCKGLPKEADLQALEALADTIAAKHREQRLC